MTHLLKLQAFVARQLAQAAGFDAVGLCEMLKDFVADKINFHSLIIERHGAIIAELYKRGKDETIYSLFGRDSSFDATTRHDLRSISKSVTSLLWRIAQAQNKTPPLSACTGIRHRHNICLADRLQ